jgi:hypothetical protein
LSNPGARTESDAFFAGADGQDDGRVYHVGDPVRAAVTRADADSGSVTDDRVISVERRAAGDVGDVAVERAIGAADGSTHRDQVNGSGVPAYDD